MKFDNYLNKKKQSPKVDLKKKKKPIVKKKKSTSKRNLNKLKLKLLFLSIVGLLFFGIIAKIESDINDGILKKKKDDEVSQKLDMYQKDWYTDGILDPKKVVQEEVINKNSNLILINKKYVVDSNYIPDLELFGEYFIAIPAVEKYEEMVVAARKDGVTLKIGSSYRSYEGQEQVFNQYLKTDDYATVLSYSAFPGTSEHQTGLAIDFVDEGICNFDKCFEDTQSGRWLKENAWEYGFILRFMEGKEDVTGYMYEPWHYRFVGSHDAKIINDTNLTLEEYVLNGRNIK